MRYDDLYLWCLTDPKNPRYVGALRLAASGKGVSLQYGQEWLGSGFALSEDLPLRNQLFLPPPRAMGEARAVGAVNDARPDRWGEKVIRYVETPERLSLMEYLYYAGDDRFGALGVSTSPAAYEPKGSGPLPRLEDAQTLSEAVSKIESSEPLSTMEKKIIAGGGSPLGGAKPKAVIEIDGAQWVIKFFNHEPVDAPLVEHASMTLAARAGITVAETRVIKLSDVHAIAIRRFDRLEAKRIHCISADTALRAASPGAPDLAYPQLALILRRRGVADGGVSQADARELFRRMVFNILIDNTDDHEKNHSLLVADPFGKGELTLAPAYDVLPTNSGQGQQELRCGSRGNESTLENAMSECSAFGLAPQEGAAEIEAVIQVMNTWQEHFREVGVTDRDIDALARQIDGKPLLSQRQGFDVRSIPVQTKAKKHSSPFARGASGQTRRI